MNELPFNLADVDFIQEGLDFSEIEPVQFENLIFHLIDEMGFSNIKWRKGGEGNSATDGGRDLEATFWSVQPASSREEKYWFEVKYRSGQLEKSQVQKTVLNAAGNTSKDILVIITNSTISNPTLDWISEFQSSHKTPSVTVWQGHDLEILLRKNPRTLSRFLPTSLSSSGRFKVIESKFSNLMLLPSASELFELWDKRDRYFDNSFLTLAACISEVSYGDINERPWGMDIEKERLISALALGIVNIYPFVFKCSSFNRDQAPIIDGLSYLVQCSLLRYGAEITAKVLFEPENLFDLEDALPDDLRFNRYNPIVSVLFHDLAMHCSSKCCLKMHYKSPQDKPDYFLRFIQSKEQQSHNDSFLVMNSNIEECSLGLVANTEYCPLGENEKVDLETLERLQERLEFARRVIEIRAEEIQENA